MKKNNLNSERTSKQTVGGRVAYHLDHKRQDLLSEGEDNTEDKTRNKNTIIILIIGVSLFFLSVFISLEKFNTANPVLTGIGLIKIMFTQNEVAMIQERPAVFLAKPDNAQQALIDFMNQEGYHNAEDERMSSTLVFDNNVARRYVEFSVNAYYSKWVF